MKAILLNAHVAEENSFKKAAKFVTPFRNWCEGNFVDTLPRPTGYAVGKNAVGGELVGNLLDCAAQDADWGGGEEKEPAAALHRSQQLQL